MELEEREKATEELTKRVEKRAKDKYGELVLTLQKGIGSSHHLLKGGKEDIFFFDFDYIVEDPLTCKEIAERFSDKVLQIAEYRGIKPDFLGFIDKDGIGTVGALRLSGFISSLTETPNILIRHNRELPYARIKVAKEYQVESTQRLEGKNILIISDVSTTGKELIDAIEEVRDNGGNVTDALVYFSRHSFETKKEFQKIGVTFYALITEPQARDYALHPENKEKASVIREVFRTVDRDFLEEQLV
jgi:orotate phosphoribosyltransferase